MKFKYDPLEKYYWHENDTDMFVIRKRKGAVEFKWKLNWHRWGMRFNIDTFKNAKALAKTLNDNVEKL